MRKGVVGLAAVLAVAGSAYAQDVQNEHVQTPEGPGQDASRQDAPHQRLSQADLNALTDVRIGMARDMLQMTPQQAQFWPPIEEAIRNSAEERYRRIARRHATPDHAGGHDADPVAIMHSRAEALAERGARLRTLAEAWQPLYQTLTPEQKDRMRLVASHVLRETRSATGRRAADLAGAEEGDED